MITNLRTALFTWLFVGLSLLMQSCVYDDIADEDVNGPADGEKAVLLLRVEAVGQSRAGDDIELMHSLRIIILDDKGKVERVRTADISSGVNSYKFPLAIPVTPGAKRIFLIANEESVNYETAEGAEPLTAYFNSINEGQGGISDALSEMVFKPDYTKNIPMTSSYDVELTPGNNEETFYVVRVATKFDVTIKNNRSDAVTLNAFCVNSVADKSFLYPKFTREGIITVKDGKKGFVFDNDTPLHWVDWLYLACEESQTKPNPPTADERGWIMEYSVPSGATHAPEQWAPTGQEIAPNGTLTLPTHYCPESCLLPNPAIDPFHADAKGIEQQYKVALTLTSGDKTRNFEAALPNLRALFRNTHVKITITLNELDVVWRIYVNPWNTFTHPQIIV